MAELKIYRNNRTYGIVQIGRVINSGGRDDNSLLSIVKQARDERKKKEDEKRKKLIEMLIK